MKKHLVFSAGLIILLLLLLGMASASASQSPTKSADQWKSEGYQVIDLADTAYRQEEDGHKAEGFIAFRKDINFLKAGSNGSFSADGHTFTCPANNLLQTGSGDFASAYCVLAGGKFYFGEKDEAASNGSTLVLKNASSVDSLDQASYMGMTVYTLGAWIDHTFDIDYKTEDPTEPPIRVHGKIHYYLDHWSHDPGMTKPTEHTLRQYLDADIDTMGIESDKVISESGIYIGLVSWRHINVIGADLSFEDFIGKVNFTLKCHYGETLTWKSFYLKLSDFDLEYDDDNGTNCEMNEMNAKGNFRYELAFGPEASADFYVFSVTLGWTLDFGIIMVPTDPPARFSPEDTKVNWHVCDECVHANLCPVAGPAVTTIKFDADPIHIAKRWPSDEIVFDPFWDFYYSNTFADYGHGTCPHYGYRTDVLVHNQDGEPLKDAEVSYETVPAHYGPESSALTPADGKATLYPPADEITVKAMVRSTAEPGKTMTHEQKVKIDNKLNTVDFEFDIPVKHVYFKNSETGEASGWPEDIRFMPFFSENVVLPNTVPVLSGRHFTGWNTKEDGSGDWYAPGTALRLTEDLTLWAQWDMAGDYWYVIYSANGGTKAPQPDRARKGMDVRLSEELPESGAMIFKGWTPDLQTMDPIYQPGDTLPYDSAKNTVILYAVWNLSPVPQPIHISFDANGAEGASLPPEIWMEQNTWVQMEYATPPLGSTYTFLGWSEDPGAEDPEFLAGELYFFYKDVTLYAIWENLESITLTFRDSLPDESSGIPDPMTVLPSMSRYVRIPSEIPQKSGRVFTGWNTTQNGSGESYAPGSVITLWKNTTLWAQWELAGDDYWHIVYDANGGTKAPRAQMIPKGEDAVLSKEPAQSESMFFKGWTTDLLAAAPEYQPGDTLPYDSAKNLVVLHAMWQLEPPKRPVVISFNANGGAQETVPNNISAPQGEKVQLPAEEPSWDAQHDFLGWTTDPKAEEPKWKAGDTAVFDQDTTLYAVWRLMVLVSFDANGGRPETVPNSISAPQGTAVRLPEESPSWDAQHSFLGWAADPQTKEPTWKAGDSVLFDQNTTLYAVWYAHYRVIEGAGSVWTKGSGKTQRFAADGDVKYFIELRVDGRPFETGVKISSGSTVAEISARAMETLSVGNHTVTFVYVDGEASASFAVQRKLPPTGDTGHPALWLSLIALGIAGLVLPGTLKRTIRRKK